MKQQKRKWDKLTDERRQECIKEIITFFKESRNESIGMIASEEVLDFVLQSVSEDIYNKGINDSKKLLKERFEDLDVELDMLVNK